MEIFQRVRGEEVAEPAVVESIDLEAAPAEDTAEGSAEATAENAAGDTASENDAATDGGDKPLI